MITANKTYRSPAVQEYELLSEGVLCESNPGGAGNLNDNDWDLTFGETNN